MHSSGATRLSAGCATVETTGPFFRWLDTVWGRKALRAPEGYDCEFTLGWLGYLGYELKRETGGSDVQAGTPDAALLFAGRAVVIDHRDGCRLAARHRCSRRRRLAWACARGRAVRGVGTPSGRRAEALGRGSRRREFRTVALEFSSRDTEDEYKSKITDAQHQIAEGNTYEVCLTTTVTASDPGLDPWESYLALRKRNPAPFASYLRFGDLTVASTSPERFLRITSDGGMRAEPIKGTRGRANDPVIDEALRRGLESSLKDRAENIMIVDLLRNDLSHFAVPGSVTVSRLCAVESYATVHQMVSTIDARLRPGAPRAEAVAAAFPAGSMTGAPKISTMDILDGLGVRTARGLLRRDRVLFAQRGDGSRRRDPDPGDGSRRRRRTHAQSRRRRAPSRRTPTPQDEYEEIRTKAFGVLSALGAEFPTT